jgi:small subunit ribosomal protein S20
MPHTASAKKRLRQNEARRLRNKARSTEIKSLRKQVQRHLHDGKIADAETLARTLEKRVDQAASVSTLHKNAAARWKARTAAAITAAKAKKA